MTSDFVGFDIVCVKVSVNIFLCTCMCASLDVHMHVDGALNPLEIAMEWQPFAGALHCCDSFAKQTPNIWGFLPQR